MAKHFVTTMNKKLFDDYGKDLLVSYMNTSQKYPIYVYVEDDIQKYPIMKNVIYVPLFEEEPECENFVRRNKNKRGGAVKCLEKFMKIQIKSIRQNYRFRNGF